MSSTKGGIWYPLFTLLFHLSGSFWSEILLMSSTKWWHTSLWVFYLLKCTVPAVHVGDCLNCPCLQKTAHHTPKGTKACWHPQSGFSGRWPQGPQLPVQEDCLKGCRSWPSSYWCGSDCQNSHEHLRGINKHSPKCINDIIMGTGEVGRQRRTKYNYSSSWPWLIDIDALFFWYTRIDTTYP